MITADEARRYLRDENGWTDAEVDEFFARVGTEPRTSDEWTRLAMGGAL